MKRSSGTSLSHCKSGAFPSPGAPNYRQGAGTVGYQKGWSSERVPLSGYSSRRYGGTGASVPFSNGRALPSKFEDAERWLFSPVSVDGAGRHSLPPPHPRRPKSKSGPLGPTSTTERTYSLASPLVPCFNSGRVANFAANSPFLAGVLMPEVGFCVKANGGRGSVDGGGQGSGKRESFLGIRDTIIKSASIHGWSDTLIESSSSLPSSQDEIFEGSREESCIVSPTAMKKDAATQMSPEGSATSSPKERPCPVASPSAHLIEELENQFAEFEVRDVLIDDRVTVTRWSKKHIARSYDKRSTNIAELKKTMVEEESFPWDPAESAKSISKYKREEAKITAWENLQKSKAEAEIRKLEMKLEKKRSYSMDKILNKLRLAQKKAQEMRTSVNARKNKQAAKNTKKSSYFRTGQISSLSGCFTCHTF